jgi:hypothetical protein
MSLCHEHVTRGYDLAAMILASQANHPGSNPGIRITLETDYLYKLSLYLGVMFEVNSLSIYIADKIKIINENLKKGLQNKDVETLELIKNPIEQLHTHIRDSIQASLREPITNLIRKLKKNEPLSGEDIRAIEKWIIGDAQHYTEIENNFQDWIKECERLGNLLAGYANPDLNQDETQLFKLNAFLTDLEFTIDDVMRYIESVNRINRFRESLGSGNIGEDEKKWLVDLIEKQLVSSDF